MKFVLCTLCLLVAALVAVSANAGMTHSKERPLINSTHFIPKAFYTLDAEGHKSDVHPISPHTAHYLRRLRRQTYTSSSSSSSSVSSDGGPAYFTSHNVNSHSPDLGYGVTGHVVHTEGVITPNGQVHYNTQQGHF